MSRPPLWTLRDLEDLRRFSLNRKSRHLDWKAIRKRFPNRSTASIYKKLWAQGWCRAQTWTPKEDEVLRLYWNDSSLRTLKDRLPGRTRNAIYERACRLGLRAGTPQGMVSVKSLAKDPSWGYDYYKTLKMLETAGVRVRNFSYSGKKVGVRYVEVDEARRAAEEWERRIADERVGKETVKEAAIRLGIREESLRNWVRAEGLLPPTAPGRKYKFWALPEVYDRIATKRRHPPVEDRRPLAKRSIRIEGADPATRIPPPA